MKAIVISSVFFALLGIVFVTGGAGLMGSRGEINWINILLFGLGLFFLGISHIGTACICNGYLGGPDDLNGKRVYRVEGQIKTSDGKNTFVVRNATGKGQARWVGNTEPLAPAVYLVKVVKDDKNQRKLVPLEEKTTISAKKTNEPDK